MSAADLDSNAWYIVTSQRYVNVSQPIDSCLQLTRDGPRVSSCDEKRFMAWQFEPVESKKGRYVMRMNATSVRQQLSVCWDSDETDDGKTVGCMRRTNAEDPQLWDIVDRGDGTYDFLNAANGTGRVLDVHQGSNLFMASKVEGTGDNNSSSSAQRWIMTSDRPVNNRVYSTVYQSEPTFFPPIPGFPTSPNGPIGPNGDISRAGLSSSAAAGIGIGAAIGGIALAGTAALLWRKRRSPKNVVTDQEPQYQEVERERAYSPKPPNYMESQRAAEAEANQVFEAPYEDPVHEVPTDDLANRHELP
ncbi:transmembrane alpha-helix domain-containing protein [Colletotrichum chrysophilum]|uniref:Transmembrane alpha-helix domain-containing protein n=1 Tax=Colletotrichum chrysophilum TaxID=1836956 RepID=A0AAD9AWR6_9PEZI|nr:transmembrane alpha-helix domain-containing protein [Colletotrichum chrysophilum]